MTKKKTIAALLLGLSAMLTPTAAQEQTPLQKLIGNDTNVTMEELVERIKATHPGVIREKGLTAAEAAKAAASARAFKAPAKAQPNKNKEFWFNMPQAERLNLARGIYHWTPSLSAPELMFEDETENMRAFSNGCVIDNHFHCIYITLSYASWGLITGVDFVYDITNDWQLYKRVDMRNMPFMHSTEVAVDPITNRVYGAFLRDDLEDYDIAWVDYDKKEIHRLGPARHYFLGIGMNAKGQLFGVDDYGDLYEISTVDGSDRKIGSTGLNPCDTDGSYYYQSADIDPEDGTFYWAITFPDGKSALYAINTDNAQAEKVTDFPNYYLAKCLTIPAQTAEDDSAPGASTDLKTNFSQTATTGTIDFKLPSKTYRDRTLVGALDYSIIVDGVLAKTGTGSAGEARSEQLTLSEGLHRIDVYASNQYGRGVDAKTTVYIGLDKPGTAKDVRLQVRGQKATVSWDAVAGEWGGYAGDVSYTVTRYPDSVVVADGLTANQLVDDIPLAEPQQYYYGVVAKAGGEQGEEALSVSKSVGRPYEVPYYEEFRDKAQVEKDFTTVDTNGDGIPWKATITSTYGYLNYDRFYNSDWTRMPADDWAFTPAITLKAGKKYTLTMQAAIADTETTTITITLGQGADVEAQTLVLQQPTVYTNTTYKDFDFPITVTEDGDYNIGFHCTSSKPHVAFRIASIKVQDEQTSASPAAPTDLVVKPADKGAWEASVTLTAPSKTQGGSNLTQLTQVRLMRQNRVVATIDNPTPGQQLTLTDKTLTEAENGVNHYLVVATNAAGDGLFAQAQAYVGLDLPIFNAQSLSATDQTSNILVKWQKVGDQGVNGGYVDTEDVSYRVYALNFDPASGTTSTGNTVATVKDADHYAIPYNTNEGSQQVVLYGASVSNKYGNGSNKPTGYTEKLVVGQPYTVPFSQSAANGRLGGKLMWVEREGESSYRESYYELTGTSYDNDNGSFHWHHNDSPYSNLYLNTGKITLRGTNNPKLMFAHMGTPKARLQLKVIVCRPNDPTGTVVKEIDYTNIGNALGTPEWAVEQIDLNAFKTEDYIVVKFFMTNTASLSSQMRNKDLYIDAINVIDQREYNLSVDIDAPSSVTVGKGKTVNVLVHNMGEKAVDSYRVRLTTNLYDPSETEVWCDTTINERLEPLALKTVAVTFAPDVFTENSTAILHAEVTTANDLYEADNTMEASVTLHQPEVGKPEQAVSQLAAGNVQLSWAAPTATIESVVESFEGDDYEDFSLSGITASQRVGKMGDWTVVNGDADTYSVNPLSVSFDNEGRVTAWMVFNTAAVDGEMYQSAHTGQKFAATFTSVKPQSNWLISPELSGEEQTVSFYANIPEPVSVNTSAAGEPYPELFEVLYSTEGTDTLQFQRIWSFEQAEAAWTRASVVVPAGAKHFAIRDVSDALNACGLFIDDVAFTRKSAQPVAYNIYSEYDLAKTVAATEALSATVPAGAEFYSVTAVYANGYESQPVEFTDVTAIRDVNGAQALTRFDVYTLGGAKVRSQATSLRGLRKGVYVVGGKTVVVK